MTVFIFFRRTDNKTITYENTFPLKRLTFLSEIRVNYVQDIIVLEDMDNLGMSRKYGIQVTSDI